MLIRQAVGGIVRKKLLKPKNEKPSRTVYRKRKQSIEALRLRYKFWVLIGTLAIATVCAVMHVEKPEIWALLSMSGGWAAFTSR
jgi:hypothetical protein